MILPFCCLMVPEEEEMSLQEKMEMKEMADVLLEYGRQAAAGHIWLEEVLLCPD